MVREKVVEHKQKEIVKQRELESLHNRAVSALENAKQEKQHLREENEGLKQELRAVKIQLSKQPGSYQNGHTLGTAANAEAVYTQAFIGERGKRASSNLRCEAGCFH